MTEPKFEDALKKLEAIVDDLEGGELNLDDAIKKYEEGMKLSGFCYKKLQDIQKKVEVLIRDSSGKLATKDFSPGSLEREENPSGEGAASRQAAKKKRPKGEELLF